MVTLSKERGRPPEENGPIGEVPATWIRNAFGPLNRTKPHPIRLLRLSDHD
jgi:hypothetical protein